MTHTAEVPAPLRRFAGVWYPLFGTTLIWLTHLIAVGAMAPPSCRDDRWVIAMHLVTAVTAVSAALPPARRVSTAARLASGCEVAVIPSQAMTGERPGS